MMRNSRADYKDDVFMGMTMNDSYNPDYFPSLFNVEERHFWFVSRNNLISALIEKIISPGDRIKKLLEVGCGTGYVMQALKGKNRVVVGMDLYREGLTLSRKRGYEHLIQGDIFAPPFRGEMNMVGLFDVLEHIRDDRLVLRDVSRILDKNGYLFLTVPAYSSLWSYFDEEAHHVRRYRVDEIKSKVMEEGFELCYVSYFMMCLFPLVWLIRKMNILLFNKKWHSSSITNQNRVEKELRIVPLFNRIMIAVLSLETRLIKMGLYLPLGTSIILIAQKKG